MHYWLDDGEWPGSCPGYFALVGCVQGIYCIGRWVSLKSCGEKVMDRKISAHSGNRTQTPQWSTSQFILCIEWKILDPSDDRRIVFRSTCDRKLAYLTTVFQLYNPSKAKLTVRWLLKLVRQRTLSPRNRVVLKKLTGSSLVKNKNSPLFMKPEGSLPHS